MDNRAEVLLVNEKVNIVKALTMEHKLIQIIDKIGPKIYYKAMGKTIY